MATCDICGEHKEELYKVLIEGSEVIACSECAKFGKIISKITEKKKVKPIEIKKVKEEVEEFEEIVVSNYATIIKNLREKLGLTQEEFAKKTNEKLSVIRHIEHGKLVPSLKLARKLENMYDIKLIEEVKIEKTGLGKNTSEIPALTLGDVIKIRKKK